MGPRDDDLLPEQTEDDRDEGWGEAGAGSRDDDERILREVPPHHGD